MPTRASAKWRGAIRSGTGEFTAGDPEGHLPGGDRRVPVRLPDVVHFTWAGDFSLAPPILPQLRALDMAGRSKRVQPVASE
jgi:hypothetical protein